MQECQLIFLLLMNSSTINAHENLARKASASNLILALKDLANLQDEPASFERFARRWPGFGHVLDEDPADTYRATAGRINYLGFSYGEPWTRMPPNLSRRFFLMWQMREALREIWRGNSDKLTEVLLPSLDEIFADPDPEGLWPPQLKVNWQSGEFVYKPRSEFQEAVHELFRQSRFIKLCANPACPAPYFIAHKTAQRYCEEACASVFQREWKRRWWKEKGTKWRRKRSRGNREKG
jgi:hypothetical protein